MIPTITCWLVRRIISQKVDANSDLPHLARQHLGHCPRCSRVYELDMGISRQLSGTAAGNRRAAPPFLHASIMSSLDRHRAAAGNQRAGASLGWSGFSLAAGVVIACAAFWLRESHSGRPVRELSTINRPAVPALPLAVNWPDQAQVRQWIGRIDGPLEKEMDLVVSDAKTAFNSLANSLSLDGPEAR